MTQVGAAAGAAIVFVGCPLLASWLASLIAFPLHFFFGFDPLAATVWGSFVILPVLWLMFFRWNLRE